MFEIEDNEIVYCMRGHHAANILGIQYNGAAGVIHWECGWSWDVGKSFPCESLISKINKRKENMDRDMMIKLLYYIIDMQGQCKEKVWGFGNILNFDICIYFILLCWTYHFCCFLGSHSACIKFLFCNFLNYYY